MGPLPGGRLPKPAAAATASADPAAGDSSPKGAVTAPPPLAKAASQGSMRKLVDEPRVASFDQPLSAVAPLESLTKLRSHAPKGRRAPSKPVKIYATDGLYRGAHWRAKRPHACPWEATSHPERSAATGGPAGRRGTPGIPITQEMTVADVTAVMFERLYVHQLGLPLPTTLLAHALTPYPSLAAPCCPHTPLPRSQGP